MQQFLPSILPYIMIVLSERADGGEQGWEPSAGTTLIHLLAARACCTVTPNCTPVISQSTISISISISLCAFSPTGWLRIMLGVFPHLVCVFPHRVRFPPHAVRFPPQGGCGSCWAFAATSALESAYLISQGNDVASSPTDFSEQQMVSCARGYGCDGGWSDVVSWCA
jgi:hypothetical protein